MGEELKALKWEQSETKAGVTLRWEELEKIKSMELETPPGGRCQRQEVVSDWFELRKCLSSHLSLEHADDRSRVVANRLLSWLRVTWTGHMSGGKWSVRGGRVQTVMDGRGSVAIPQLLL